MSRLPLSFKDRKRLVDELMKLPRWVDGGTIGERSVLRDAGFPDRLVNGLPLSGIPTTDASTAITTLQRFGHLEGRPTHFALGALVEYVLDSTPHVEGRMFLAYLIRQYDLITDLGYQEGILEEYPLIETAASDTLSDLGWETRVPLTDWQGPTAPHQLERIWSRRAPFLDASFLEKGARVVRAVCRIERRDGSAVGTGFSVGPNLVLTCHHVVPLDDEAEETQVRFGYVLDDGHLRPGRVYQVKRAVCRSARKELDYAVLELEDSPGDDPKIGYLEPVAKHLKPGSAAYIIQHPKGDPQKVVLQDNWITYVADDSSRVQYLTNTEYGSSGSPVCNGSWEVVALHHSRALLPASSKTAHIRGNEGIPMMVILPEIQDFLP